MNWRIERVWGDVGSLHGASPPEHAERVVRILEIEQPCVVLGSSQNDAIVDYERALTRGVSVIRRRSGGGAVWMAPGDQCWLDLWLPAGDPLWVDDVVHGAFWAGEAWAAAAVSVGVASAEVHRGGLARTPLADLVCFAGRGPGEVFSGDQKLTGISQRRTRDWVRLQTMAYRVWEPERLVDVLTLTDRRRAELPAELMDAVVAFGTPDVVADAVVGCLPQA